MPTIQAGQLDKGADPTRKRSLGEDAVPAHGHSRNAVPENYRTIEGWGVDLDPANRPMVPMEFPSTVRTARGEVKHWQVPRAAVHVSNEQPGLTPVFGDTLPPKGLSGALRDYAFEFGEGTNRHWLTLMLADRLERMGRMGGDALRGHPDNYIAEKGWFAGMKYRREGNRAGSTLLTAGAIFGGVLLGATILRQIRDRG